MNLAEHRQQIKLNHNKSNQVLVFGERRKSKHEKTSLSRVENQKTQPKYDAVWELKPGHIGGG